MREVQSPEEDSLFVFSKRSAPLWVDQGKPAAHCRERQGGLLRTDVCMEHSKGWGEFSSAFWFPVWIISPFSFKGRKEEERQRKKYRNIKEYLFRYAHIH
jgi:hypothetical protein